MFKILNGKSKMSLKDLPKKKEIVKNTISEWYRKVYYFTFFNGRSSLPGLIK